MFYRFALAASLCLASSFAQAETQPLTCGGIPANSTAASLAKTYGAANVVTQSVAGAEGAEVKTTVIFPKDKSKRLIVFWKDESARKGIDSLIVRRDDKANPTNWEIAGLTLASTLADIEKANGKSFQLSGFGWDYGGFVNEWNGGKLEKLAGGCRLILRLEPGKDANPDATDKVSGDARFTSSDPNMKAAKPQLVELTLAYPD